MKKKFTLLFLVLGLLTACGKDGGNTSGNSTSPVSSSDLKEGFVDDTAQSFADINQLRSAFSSKSMSDGIGYGMQIFHVGNYFVTGSSTSSGGSFYGCIDLGFWSAGDCNNYSGNYYEQQMRAAIQNGRIIEIDSATESSVRYRKALDVKNGQYVYGSYGTYDKNFLFYKQMLGIGGYDGYIQLKRATITLSNGTQVDGVGIRNQYGWFVVSTNFATIANPIYAHTNDGKSGALSQVGTGVRVQKISVPELNINYIAQ